MEFNHSPSVDKILNENCCFFCRETTLIKKQCHKLWNYDYFCPHCGYYRISEDIIYNLHDCYKFRVFGTALAQERKLTGQDNYNLQWCDIQENDNEHQVCIGNMPFLNSYPKDYLEKLDRILINIGRKTNNSPLNYYQPDYHDFGLFFVEPQVDYYQDDIPSNNAVNFVKYSIVETINILEGLDWIKKSPIHEGDLPTITLLVNGLKHLRELHNIAENKSQPFVAMWFPEKKPYVGILQKYVNSITKAALQAGYSDPYIANRDKYNGAIMNKVINQIKKSRFLIADLTCSKLAGMRGGVYYEAGMAAGLGMPVILTCYKKAQERVHFDLKQFNTIIWDIDKDGMIRADGHPDMDFSEYVAEWIKATVGERKK